MTKIYRTTLSEVRKLIKERHLLDPFQDLVKQIDFMIENFEYLSEQEIAALKIVISEIIPRIRMWNEQIKERIASY